MEIKYTTDVGQWKSWQTEYRFGVIVIFPPDPPLKEVNTLRSKYDPVGQAICQAHISLTVPFSGAADENSLEELRAIARRFEPFSIQYGPLSNYLPHPGVVLAVEPQAKLNLLRTNLERASIFEGAPPRRFPFSAHMTIAEFISVERTKELMGELSFSAPNGYFTCDHLIYAVPDDDFHFTERAILDLARK